jgi:hypothetical protein
MKKKYLLFGAGLVISGIAYCFVKKKFFIKKDSELSVDNGDKITATSLSDAQDKTSVKTS